MKPYWSEVQKSFAVKMAKELSSEKGYSDARIARVLGVTVSSVRSML